MARNFVSPQQEPVVITVAVPGQRLGWLKRELEAAGMPYEVQRAEDGYNLRTLEQAQPVVGKVLGYQPVPGGTGKVNAMPNDLRVLGFVACLVFVVGSFVSIGEVAPDLMLRGGLFLVGGAVVVFLLRSQLLNDGRRWLFVLGMMGLFAAGALWFWGKGLGIL